MRSNEMALAAPERCWFVPSVRAFWWKWLFPNVNARRSLNHGSLRWPQEDVQLHGRRFNLCSSSLASRWFLLGQRLYVRTTPKHRILPAHLFKVKRIYNYVSNEVDGFFQGGIWLHVPSLDRAKTERNMFVVSITPVLAANPFWSFCLVKIFGSVVAKLKSFTSCTGYPRKPSKRGCRFCLQVGLLPIPTLGWNYPLPKSNQCIAFSVSSFPPVMFH